MKKHVNDLIDQQNRYEKLIITQGTLLSGLSKKALKLAANSKGGNKERKDLLDFINKYGIGK